ncbi:hypothetical protein HOI83_00965 [Candidatus Uhrbacteria bacterium]|jgi:hypothetical protein|nr:hypothetical protein [Candidatus Uhrbacteria bacterium]
MTTLTVYILALIPEENWLRRTRAERESSLFGWLDEEGVELREMQWDGRVDTLIQAAMRGEKFAVRASNYMSAPVSSDMGSQGRGRPKPDSRSVVVRTCAALGVPIFYNGHLMRVDPRESYSFAWEDDGLGREQLIDALREATT